MPESKETIKRTGMSKYVVGVAFDIPRDLKKLCSVASNYASNSHRVTLDSPTKGGRTVRLLDDLTEVPPLNVFFPFGDNEKHSRLFRDEVRELGYEAVRFHVEEGGSGGSSGDGEYFGKVIRSITTILPLDLKENH